MASGASKGAFTCPKPVQVDVVVDGNVQQVIALFCLNSVLLSCFSNLIGDCVKIACKAGDDDNPLTPMLNPEGKTLELKGNAHILEMGRLEELRVAHNPEATILNPILPDIVLDLVTDHVGGSQR